MGVELFLFTDNSTAGTAFYKSGSSRLFELILRTRKLAVSVGCNIRFIHVARTSMIIHGTDGTSRGDTHEGVMKGDEVFLFVPLDQTACNIRIKVE